MTHQDPRDQRMLSPMILRVEKWHSRFMLKRNTLITTLYEGQDGSRGQLGAISVRHQEVIVADTMVPATGYQQIAGVNPETAWLPDARSRLKFTDHQIHPVHISVAHQKCYWPFWVRPWRRFSWLVPYEPIEWDQDPFRTKESCVFQWKNGEGQARLLEYPFSLAGCGPGCFMEFKCWAGRRGGAPAAQGQFARGVCTQLAAATAILNCSVERRASAHAPKLRSRHSSLALGTFVWSTWWEASSRSILWSSETTGGTKKKKKRLDLLLC